VRHQRPAELRILHLLDRCSATWSMLPALKVTYLHIQHMVLEGRSRDGQCDPCIFSALCLSSYDLWVYKFIFFHIS
jgi:hypothetical protein